MLLPSGVKKNLGALSVRDAYMYVPNFGRVQVVLTDYPDGKSYPLVTLPKMTPYDIFAVLDKQKKAIKERSWWGDCMLWLRQASCGLLKDSRFL